MVAFTLRLVNSYKNLKIQMEKEKLRHCKFNIFTQQEFTDDDMVAVFKKQSDPENPICNCYTLEQLDEWFQIQRLRDLLRRSPETYALPSNSRDTISKKDAKDVGQRVCKLKFPTANCPLTIE